MLPSASSDRTIYFTAHIVEYTQNKSLPFRSTPRHITSTITAMETISNSFQHLQIQKLTFSLIAINPTRSNLKSHPNCHIRYVLYPLIFVSHKMPFLSFFKLLPQYKITVVFRSPLQCIIVPTTLFHYALRNSIVAHILSHILIYTFS